MKPKKCLLIDPWHVIFCRCLRELSSFILSCPLITGKSGPPDNWPHHADVFGFVLLGLIGCRLVCFDSYMSDLYHFVLWPDQRVRVPFTNKEQRIRSVQQVSIDKSSGLQYSMLPRMWTRGSDSRFMTEKLDRGHILLIMPVAFMRVRLDHCTKLIITKENCTL